MTHRLYQAIPEIFPRRMDWTKIQQCKRKPDEPVLDFFEHFEKTFKRYSGLSPDSFKDHQNDPLLNSAFLEGLDEELVTLIKQHKLNWQTTHADELALLADQLSKTIQKKEKKDKATQIMNLQLQQLSNQASLTPKSLRKGEKGVCFYCKKPGHYKKDCRKLKWDLKRENRQKQA